MILSILIPSVKIREKKLNRLLFYLSSQILRYNLSDVVEIIVYVDNFETPTYKKRNSLIRAAVGKYVVFIDDDDSVPNTYVKTIVEALSGNDVDYVGYQVLVAIDGFFSRETIHSLRYSGWSEDSDFYYRDVTHINPIRASIAKLVEFPELRWGEDSAWANSIRGKVLTEVFIDKVMYFYDSNSNTTLMVYSGEEKNRDKHQDINWKNRKVSYSFIHYLEGEK